jgi:hypothetical protein
MNRLRMLAAALGLLGLLGGCASADRGSAGHQPGSLRLIGEQRIPLKQDFRGTVAGGFSGIDFDARSGEWVLVTDDRSAHNPVRYYTLRLGFDAARFDSLAFSSVTTLLQADGTPYPDSAGAQAGKGELPDIESVRIDPRDGTLWYSSEGERRFGMDPFVRHASRDGKLLGSLALPPMFRIDRSREWGPRNNLSFEGLSFAPDGGSFWLALESPLYQDGPIPTPQHGALSRITQLDRDGRILRQFAYPVDPIPAEPGPGKACDNGISEILAVRGEVLLVLERAAVQGADGKYVNYVRLYETDARGATDTAAIPALNGVTVVPARKRLLLDLSSLQLPMLDNLEGMSWGPRLANGNETLVLISDDNFSATQITQLLLFEVLPQQ